MSPHAQYFVHDLGARQARQLAVLRALVLIVLAALAVLALATHRELATRATAVHASAAEGRPLASLDELATARLDGFRAGLREAQEQGCTVPPALQHPLERP